MKNLFAALLVLTLSISPLPAASLAAAPAHTPAPAIHSETRTGGAFVVTDAKGNVLTRGVLVPVPIPRSTSGGSTSCCTPSANLKSYILRAQPDETNITLPNSSTTFTTCSSCHITW